MKVTTPDVAEKNIVRLFRQDCRKEVGESADTVGISTEKVRKTLPEELQTKPRVPRLLTVGRRRTHKKKKNTFPRRSSYAKTQSAGLFASIRERMEYPLHPPSRKSSQGGGQARGESISGKANTLLSAVMTTVIRESKRITLIYYYSKTSKQ